MDERDQHWFVAIQQVLKSQDVPLGIISNVSGQLFQNKFTFVRNKWTTHGMKYNYRLFLIPPR